MATSQQPESHRQQWVIIVLKSGRSQLYDGPYVVQGQQQQAWEYACQLAQEMDIHCGDAGAQSLFNDTGEFIFGDGGQYTVQIAKALSVPSLAPDPTTS